MLLYNKRFKGVLYMQYTTKHVDINKDVIIQKHLVRYHAEVQTLLKGALIVLEKVVFVL